MLVFLVSLPSTCETRTTRFGHIQSEDGSYSTFTERCWVLDPPDATTITLSFQRFDTEANYDVVRVYDGGDTSAPQLSPSRGFSGTAIPSQHQGSSSADAENALAGCLPSSVGCVRQRIGWA